MSVTGVTYAVAAFRLDVDLQAEVVNAVARAVGQQPQAAELEVVWPAGIGCVGLRPVNEVHLHVPAELDGPFLGGQVGPAIVWFLFVTFLFRSLLFLLSRFVVLHFEGLKQLQNDFDLRGSLFIHERCGCAGRA